MAKHFTKQTIDEAGNLCTGGVEGGWNKVAEILTTNGHTNSSGSYIHGQALCSEVLADPNWSHLRKGRLFGSGRRQVIIDTLTNAGLSQAVISDIMKRLN